MSAYTILGTDAEGIETIKGNGWDINSERIELNGINAEFNREDDYRYISMNGPAVEDIFKCLRELIKENGALTEKNEILAEENYCDEQGRTYQTEMDKRDCYIKALKTKIERINKVNKELEKYCEEQEEKFDMEINKRDGYIDCLKRKLDEKTENYNRLQDAYLKEINEQDKLRKYIQELKEENDEFVYTVGIQGHEIKSLREKLNEEKIDADVVNYCMNDVMMTKKVYDTDITRMYPSTYSDTAKEILGWIDGEMKNGTDYATKIFNKEEVGNMFSITFCKVPVKSEEDE